jgi:hypothetical protein
MAEKKKQYDPGPAFAPGTGDQDQEPGGARRDRSAVQPDGRSGGVTDIDARDGEADDSNSGYSDEDLMRTGGGGRTS